MREVVLADESVIALAKLVQGDARRRVTRRQWLLFLEELASNPDGKRKKKDYMVKLLKQMASDRFEECWKVARHHGLVIQGPHGYLVQFMLLQELSRIERRRRS